MRMNELDELGHDLTQDEQTPFYSGKGVFISPICLQLERIISINQSISENHP
jgi:hypothetical protein